MINIINIRFCMKSSSALRIGASLVVLSTSLVAKDHPLVDLGAYGQLVQYREMNGPNQTTVMIVPEFKFHLIPGVTFDLEIGLENGKDPDIEEAAFTIGMGENWTTRIGKMHLPVGVYNLYHEPVYFHSVFPSEVEQKIIPNEWHENGLLLSYHVGGGTFSAGAYGGLSQQGMSGSQWIRGTSLEGKIKRPDSYAAVVRYDYGNIDEGMLIGGSFYHSGLSGIEPVGRSEVTLWELHMRKLFDNGIEIDALYAQGTATKTVELSSALGDVIGKKTEGWYINTAYDIAPLIHLSRAETLPLFVRYEKFNTQAEVEQALPANGVNNRTVTTVGVNYRPWPNVVFKADYQFRDNKGAGERDRIEFGAGFVY